MAQFNFGGGCPDPGTLPAAELGAAAGRVLPRLQTALANYPEGQGWRPLREVAAMRFERREGVPLDPDTICLANGSQQPITLFCQALLGPGRPVIVGDKYEEDVGGGVSQVATTVFNAAWEAGLPISERNPHALYIARYQLGRDATVNFPNLDLKFVNDTGHWIVLGAGAGGNGIYVSLYGTDTGRRVESIPGELRVTGAPLTETEKDPDAFVGETEVLFEGEPSRAVSVQRIVYERDGTVRRRETWSTSYRSEPKQVRVGTKPVPKPPTEKTKDEKPTTTTPDPAVTTPTETTPTTTGTQPR